MPLGGAISFERGKLLFYRFNSSNVRTVADRHRLLLVITTSTADELSGGTNIDDLEQR